MVDHRNLFAREYYSDTLIASPAFMRRRSVGPRPRLRKSQNAGIRGELHGTRRRQQSRAGGLGAGGCPSKLVNQVDDFFQREHPGQGPKGDAQALDTDRKSLGVCARHVSGPRV